MSISIRYPDSQQRRIEGPVRVVRARFDPDG
jgi:hypothetical protein